MINDRGWSAFFGVMPLKKSPCQAALPPYPQNPGRRPEVLRPVLSDSLPFSDTRLYRHVLSKTLIPTPDKPVVAKRESRFIGEPNKKYQSLMHDLPAVLSLVCVSDCLWGKTKTPKKIRYISYFPDFVFS